MALVATACAPKPEAPAAATWADLDRAGKVRFMKERVLPAARQLFATYDPERYAAIDCTLCHGDRALEGDYRMPNPDLLPLAFGPDSGYSELKKRRPEIIAFMKQRLMPRMVELLGETPWSPDNPGGFGCWSCHSRGERIDPAALERKSSRAPPPPPAAPTAARRAAG